MTSHDQTIRCKTFNEAMDRAKSAVESLRAKRAIVSLKTGNRYEYELDRGSEGYAPCVRRVDRKGWPDGITKDQLPCVVLRGGVQPSNSQIRKDLITILQKERRDGQADLE